MFMTRPNSPRWKSSSGAEDHSAWPPAISSNSLVMFPCRSVLYPAAGPRCAPPALSVAFFFTLASSSEIYGKVSMSVADGADLTSLRNRYAFASNRLT
jgi:hypothetical protein